MTSLTSLAIGCGEAHGLPADPASAARALAGLRCLPALRSLALELAPPGAAGRPCAIAPPLAALLAALPGLRGACPALAAVAVDVRQPGDSVHRELRRPLDAAEAAAAEPCVEAARAANPGFRIDFRWRS